MSLSVVHSCGCNSRVVVKCECECQVFAAALCLLPAMLLRINRSWALSFRNVSFNAIQSPALALNRITRMDCKEQYTVPLSLTAVRY